MIRRAEIARFLESVSEAISGELRPDLKSAHTKKSADALIMVLNRLSADFREGGLIAAERLAGWENLRRDLQQTEETGRRDVAASSDALEALGVEIGCLQQDLANPGTFNRLVDDLKGPAAPRSAWFREAAGSIFEMMEKVEDSVAPIPPPRPGRSVLDNADAVRAKLSAYLEKRFPELPPGPVTDFRLTPGGHVKETALFTLASNKVLPSRLVLRRDLAKSITGTSVIDEYPIIERVFKLGLPVPEPLLLESDPSILDGSFMIMTEIADADIAGTYFAKERAQAPRTIGPEFGRETAAVMAQLHASTALSAAEIDKRHVDHLKEVRAVYETWLTLPKPPLSIPVDLGFAWLFSHPLPADRPRCLVHGDFSLHNIMARDGHFAALLDWELAREGDPAEDLAECRMLMLEDVMSWEDYAAAYVAAGGDPRACDPHAVAYQCVWMLLNHYVMNARVRDYFVSGERSDPLAASIASHFADRLLQYQARAVKLATELLD